MAEDDKKFTPNGIEIRPGQHQRLAKSVEVTVTDPEGWDIGGRLYKQGEKVAIRASELQAAKKRYAGKFQGSDRPANAPEQVKKPVIQVHAVTNGTKGVRSKSGLFSPDMLGAKVSGGKVNGQPALVVVESWESEDQITVSQALDTGTPVLEIESLETSA